MRVINSINRPIGHIHLQNCFPNTMPKITDAAKINVMPLGKVVNTYKTMPPNAYCDTLLYLASCFMIPPIIPPLPRGVIGTIIAQLDGCEKKKVLFSEDFHETVCILFFVICILLKGFFTFLFPPCVVAHPVRVSRDACHFFDFFRLCFISVI